MSLSAKQRATWEAIFENPVRANIRWTDIESLFRALGANVREGEGSRLRVSLGDVRATFHRPHPRPEAGRETIRDVRAFLTRAGVAD